MKKLSLLLASIVAVIGLSLSFAPAALAQADCDPSSGLQGGVECAGDGQKVTNLFGNGGIFNTIVNVLLFIIGAVSVVMIIYGGVRYVTSAGEAKSVESAKNTIMYAIIGLIISILAYAIVNFVVGSFLPNN